MKPKKQKKSPEPEINLKGKPKAKAKGRRNKNGLDITKTSVMVGNALNKITKGALDRQTSPFEIGYNKIYSKRVKMVLQISELPFELTYGYVDNLKVKVRRVLGNINSTELDIYSVQHCSLNHIVFNKKMRNKEMALKNALDAKIRERNLKLNPIEAQSAQIAEMAKYDPRLADSIKKQTASRFEVDIYDKEINRLKSREQSFAMVNDYQNNGGSCMNVYNFLEVVSDTQELCIKAIDELKRLLMEDGFQFKEIIDLENYQKAFAPTSLRKIIGKGSEFIGKPYFTLSNTVPMVQNFRPSILSAPSPEMYIGQNIENQYRVDINLTNNNSPNNYLVIGESSSGKSTWVKVALLTWLDNPYAKIIIKEYKGKGWDKFMLQVGDKGNSITMDLNNPKFVNTYKIPLSNEYSFSQPNVPYQLCFNITVKTILTLLNGNNDATPTQTSLATKLVEKVFRNNGVIPNDPTTYWKSENIYYIKHTWIALEQLVSDPDILNTFDIKDLSNFKQALSVYFSPDGTKKNIFGKELSVNEVILNSRVILFDYNVYSIASSGDTISSEIAVRILQQAFIEKLFCNYNKNKGNYTVIVTEDLNEQIGNPYIFDSVIESWKTSSHLNIINFATINSLDTVDTDGTNVNKYTKLLSQLEIGGYIVGQCSSVTAEYLKENTELKSLGNTLSTICKTKDIKYVFLVYNKYHALPTCLVKMPLTEELLMCFETATSTPRYNSFIGEDGFY